jgi:hypothetical protein
MDADVARLLLAASLVYVACSSPGAQRPGAGTATRRDVTVASDPGISIAVREVVVPDHAAAVPVLLVHGAGGGGVAAFDVPVPGYSLAEDLARALGLLALKRSAALKRYCVWVQTAVVWLVQLRPYAVPLQGEQTKNDSDSDPAYLPEPRTEWPHLDHWYASMLARPSGCGVLDLALS